MLMVATAAFWRLSSSIESSITVAHTMPALLPLTSAQVHLISIMLWHERISFLTSHNKFVPALELAMSFYEESGLAAVGMPKSRSDRRKVSGGGAELMVTVVKNMVIVPHSLIFTAHTFTAHTCASHTCAVRLSCRRREQS